MHLVSLVEGRVSLGPAAVRSELIRYQLEENESAVLALLLISRRTTGPGGLERVEALLSEGRLAEAAQTAQTLPDVLDSKKQALHLVKAARDNLAQLLKQAEAARRTDDEARAMLLLREAAAISQEEAEMA